MLDDHSREPIQIFRSWQNSETDEDEGSLLYHEISVVCARMETTGLYSFVCRDCRNLFNVLGAGNEMNQLPQKRIKPPPALFKS